MKTSFRGLVVLSAIGALGGLTCTAHCQTWDYNVTISGVPFSRARTTAAGVVIGYIDRDLTIGGRPCRKGWIHLFSSGAPAGFTNSKAIAFERFVIPAGSWVVQDRNGAVTICAFPHNIEIQGHVCRGGIGGSEGVQTAFYPSGALKQYFPANDVVVDGIPCRASVFRTGIELYENGRLRAATLSRACVVDGRQLEEGTRIRLAPDGRLVSR
ncbi:MAG TPA: hypothetical protein VHE61_05130 [Opitutaceae bacterium]|nr:hypothetical protein [Opitutaceae bacterium]